MENVVIKKQSAIRRLFMISEFASAFGLLLLCVLLTFTSPYFLTLTNIMGILRQMSITCIVAIGQQMLLSTGCVDLTVGIGMGLTGVVAARLFGAGLSAPLVLILTILAGVFVGFFNGFIVTYFKAIPFIVTLGTMSLVRGTAALLCDSRPIRFDTPLNFLGGGYLFGELPVSAVIMFVLVAVFWVFTNKTSTGRNMYAVGNNEKSAELSGINVGRVRLIAYMITGGLVAISGIISAGNIMSADPMTGYGMEMDIVVACVIGGASLYGGSGTVIGAMIGSAIMSVLKAGFVLLGVANYWQTMSVGIIVIVLLYVDVLRKKQAKELD